MLRLSLLAGLALVVLFRHWPSCYTRDCRRPFVWQWRRFDDGVTHLLCGRCARHIDRMRAQRARLAP